MLRYVKNQFIQSRKQDDRNNMEITDDKIVQNTRRRSNTDFNGDKIVIERKLEEIPPKENHQKKKRKKQNLVIEK